MKCEIFHPFLPKKTTRFTSILLAPHCVFHFLFPVLHLHIHKYQFSGDLTQQVLQMKSIRHQGFLFFYFYTESKKKKAATTTNKQTNNKTKQNLKPFYLSTPFTLWSLPLSTLPNTTTLLPTSCHLTTQPFYWPNHFGEALQQPHPAPVLIPLSTALLPPQSKPPPQNNLIQLPSPPSSQPKPNPQTREIERNSVFFRIDFKVFSLVFVGGRIDAYTIHGVSTMALFGWEDWVSIGSFFVYLAELSS